MGRAGDHCRVPEGAHRADHCQGRGANGERDVGTGRENLGSSQGRQDDDEAGGLRYGKDNRDSALVWSRRMSSSCPSCRRWLSGRWIHGSPGRRTARPQAHGKQGLRQAEVV